MPFSIKDFPVTTREPKIDVDLPEGTYVFELVVEDSTGQMSVPDRVTITVKRAVLPEPIIIGITPGFGLPGEKDKKAKIHGEHLHDAHEVLFWRDSEQDPHIQARIDDDARPTDTELPISITISGDDAAIGDYTYSVSTPAGEARSPAGQTFSVSASEISDIDPLFAHKEKNFDVKALITGSRLLVEDEPLSAHSVEFFYGSQPPDPGAEPDRGIVATILEDSTPEQLKLRIVIGDEAQLGEHIIVVTTPAGKGYSPPDKLFDMRGPRKKIQAS